MNPKAKFLSSVLLGLVLGCISGLAQTTNIITQADFDTESFGYTYGYSYAGGDGGVGWASCDSATYNTSSNNAPFGVEVAGVPSQALLVTADFTELPSNEVWINSHVYTYSGFGAGTYFGSGNLDLTAINTTNPAAYIFSCDARALGMSSTAPAIFVLIFEAPDDTIQPPDGDYDKDILLQAEYTTQVSSNFTHFNVLLSDDKVVFTKGSMANLYAHASEISGFRIEAKSEQAVPSYGFDADNGLVVDNLSLASTYAPPPPPTVPLAILDWNMDDKPLDYAWSGGTNSGWSANGVLATHLLQQPSVGTGVGGGNSLLYWMMNDIYATNDPLPSWAGGQGGMGGTVNLANLNSPNLGNYLLSMDARVEGLDPAATTADFDIQTLFNAPAPLGTLIRCDSHFSGIESNWTHVSMLLNKAGVGVGSAASFAANYSQVSEIPLQPQLNNVANQSLWGFDTDNKVFLDNIKLERLVVALPSITIARDGSHTIVSWVAPASGTCVLQSTTTPQVVASWVDVSGATSPYTNSVVSQPKYFRTKWIAP